jgi:osmotically-inducible protein OsmY
MKSNSELQQDVIDELRWDPSTRDCEIGVSARDGVVTLSGEVASYAQKLAAEAAAERVAGVRALAEDLKVKLPSMLERSDTDLAHACLNALKWDVDVPDDRLQLKVENGWVTVEGTVSTHFQRQAAERAVRYLTGVKGIINHAVVKPAGVSTTEVGRKIKAALHRSAELDASRIQVETHDGRVTLKGTVRSWAERTDAERAAWSAPGVTAIDDQIVVGV